MHERKLMSGSLLLKDSARGEVQAVFASLDQVDKDLDTYAPGALRAGTAVVSSWNHNSTGVGGLLPVGKATVRTIGNEAVADIQYWLDLERAREAFEVVKRLGQVEWSWQLDIHAAEPATVNGQPVRIIRDVSALEVSPVVQAAGVGTRTLELRSTSEGLAREAARFVRNRHNERQRRALAAIRERV